jgi:hypothetical protein
MWFTTDDAWRLKAVASGLQCRYTVRMHKRLGGYLLLLPAQLVSVPRPAAATLDERRELPLGKIQDRGRHTPPLDAVLVLCELLGRYIAPTEDGAHLIMAIQQKPRPDPCFAIKTDEVH